MLRHWDSIMLYQLQCMQYGTVWSNYRPANFEVFRAQESIPVFWDVMLCHSVCGSGRFKGKCRLHLQGFCGPRRIRRGTLNDGKPISETATNPTRLESSACGLFVSSFAWWEGLNDTQLHNNTPGTMWFVWHRMKRRTVNRTVRVLEPVSWSAFEHKVYVCPSLNIRKRSSTLCVVPCQPWVWGIRKIPAAACTILGEVLEWLL